MNMNSFTAAERQLLLALAREAITAHVNGQREPIVREESLTPGLREILGCFVTLCLRGELRGCIGNIQPSEPLYRAVMENARGAAFRDSRFDPVGPGEVSELEIEISVLSQPRPLAQGTPDELVRLLRPGVDGVVLKAQGRTATFLPQVWRRYPEPARFMDLLAEKARLPEGSWREPDAIVMTYHVEAFEEPPRG